MNRQRKRSGNNWIGMVIFLIVMLGSPLASFLSGLILQLTGVSVSSSTLMIGVVVLAVLASVVSSAVRGAGRINTGSETTLPSGPVAPPQMSAPSRPAMLPPTMSGAGQPPSQLSGTPSYEPIINPRVLTFGVIGLVLFGGVFLAILAMSGAI